MHILDAILIAVAGLIACRYVWGLVNEAERKAAADAALERAVEAYKARLVAAAVIREMQERNSQVPEATHPFDEIPYNLRKVIMPEPVQTDPKEWN